ncbi:protein AmtB [Pseudomonas syringae pv. actinidiae ICMP 19096]|uniref:Protein AmtB n=1 Tax=Pseudomonas syringae pv. actinidiae ICMP 19096 TaxID=1194405 RepID=A0A656JMM9_PSESF|nr:protein AmtB [Pseudomonas syringae pv. actinidiae ICMP 19096]
MVAGLVAITPAAGTVGPMGALIIGLAAGVICFFCATSLKRKLGYDDSLDAFGVHGIGGAPALGGFGTVTDIGAQVWIQFKGVAFTVVYTAIVTFIILKVLDAVMGLRVTDEEESVGLDLAQHNERGYNL